MFSSQVGLGTLPDPLPAVKTADLCWSGTLRRRRVSFNLGLIALLTPVTVPERVRLLDWPFLVLTALVAAVFLIRGRVGRAEGAVLAVLGVAYAVLHV